MKNNGKVIVVLVAGLLFGITLALFLQSKAVEAKRVQDREIARKVVTAVGPSLLAEAYKLPLKDYRRLMDCKNQLLRTQKISDGDLDFILALLKPESGFIVHSRVLAMLELNLHASDSQKEKIRTALQPFVKQNDPQFRLVLKKIQKHVFGNPDWQPGQPFA